MYVCGPTVYQRAHIGNARPFVVFSWLRNWLRERGYDVTLVHNITDVNDKIYEAAPGASAARAAEATRWYLEDTGAFGLGRPTSSRWSPRRCPRSSRSSRSSSSAGHAYEVDGDVYFRVAQLRRRTVALSGQRPDQVEEQEPNPRKEDPRDFALWKANKEGEDTSVGVAVGARPPGLAHRVLGDGGEARSGRSSRSTAAGSTSSSRTTRTSWRSRGRVGRRVRADLDAQRDAALHR